MVKKDWTFEEAWAANEAAVKADPAQPSRTQPFFVWVALNVLDDLEKRYQDDQYALMTAIRICAQHDLPLPDWAARAFILAYDKVTTARAKSWDTVFGNPYPKGTHLSAVRKRLEYRYVVWNETNDILKWAPDTPIDEALFETVGKKFNLGKTLACEYYYEVKSRIGSKSPAKL